MNKTLTEAATLSNHKSTKITRDHYLREVTTFDAKKQNKKQRMYKIIDIKIKWIKF